MNTPEHERLAKLLHALAKDWKPGDKLDIDRAQEIWELLKRIELG